MAQKKGYKHTEETKKKIGLANKGKPNINKGKKLSEKVKINMRLAHPRGKNHPQWKGDKVSYSGLHNWVRKLLGIPTKCDLCKKDGLIGRKIHWASISRKYKRDINDWVRLCVSCHWKYDQIYLKRQRDKLGKFI